MHDRTYMKEDAGWQPRGPLPKILWILVAHVAGIVAHAGARGWFDRPIEEWTVLTWDGLRAGRVWTVLTHPLVGEIPNLWWLFFVGLVWYFGKLLEEWLGAERFLQFAVAAVLAGAAAFVLAFATGAGRALGGDGAFGLSGLATAMVVHAAFREPRMPVSIWFVQVPLWLFAVVWLAYDTAVVLRLVGSGTGSLWIDLGAALFAFAAWKWDLVPDVRGWWTAARRRRARTSAARAPAAESATQERVDALLDKINERGMASLTDSEREFLKQASKRR